MSGGGTYKMVSRKMCGVCRRYRNMRRVIRWWWWWWWWWVVPYQFHINICTTLRKKLVTTLILLISYIKDLVMVIMHINAPRVKRHNARNLTMSDHEGISTEAFGPNNIL